MDSTGAEVEQQPNLLTGARRAELLGQATVLLAEATRLPVVGLSNDALIADVLLAEQVSRLSGALSVAAAGEVAERSRSELGNDGIAQKHFHRTGTMFLEHLTRGFGGEMARRVRVGLATRERTSLTGMLMPALYPRIAEALTAGTIGVDAAYRIVVGLDQAATGGTIHPDALAAAEAALVTAATEVPVVCVEDQVKLWRDALNPDGTEPRDTDTRTRRGFRMGREVNGITRSILDTAPKETALLKAILDEARASNTPRFLPTDGAVELDGVDVITTNKDGSVTTDDGETIDPQRLVGAQKDPRTREQHQHDVLFGLVTAGMRASENETGGMRSTTTVLAISTLPDILSGVGTGWLEGAVDPISMTSIRQMACSNGGVQNIVLGNSGEVLYLGPVPRLFSPAQKRALCIRDGGCSVTGCDVPARQCEAHHVIEWKPNGQGGPTDINNGALLCEWHHHALHASDYRMTMIDGKPHLLTPPDINPNQQWQPMGKTRALMKPNPPDNR